MKPHWLLGVPLAALVAGCATMGAPMSSSPEPSSVRPPFTTAPQLSPSSPATAAPTASIPARQWEAILADLTQRGVPTEAAQVQRAQRVTWNDGSLGCPEPGVMYTQALMEGLWVVVRVGDQEFDYRFGRGDAPTLCRNPPTRLPSSQQS
ncbi:MAG: hypothetical protein WAS07_13425 [Micropruina sp.]